jgi:hypothetical protein
MMNGNDPVYPSYFFPEQYNPEFGLTKRELIAAMAMQGLLAKPEEGRQFPIHINVAEAIEYADELIRQLSKEVQGE